jgi:hypothetical protein
MIREPLEISAETFARLGSLEPGGTSGLTSVTIRGPFSRTFARNVVIARFQVTSNVMFPSATGFPPSDITCNFFRIGSDWYLHARARIGAIRSPGVELGPAVFTLKVFRRKDQDDVIRLKHSLLKNLPPISQPLLSEIVSKL